MYSAFINIHVYMIYIFYIYCLDCFPAFEVIPSCTKDYQLFGLLLILLSCKRYFLIPGTLMSPGWLLDTFDGLDLAWTYPSLASYCLLTSTSGFYPLGYVIAEWHLQYSCFSICNICIHIYYLITIAQNWLNCMSFIPLNCISPERSLNKGNIL